MEREEGCRQRGRSTVSPYCSHSCPPRLLAQRQQHSFGLHGVACVGTEAHLSLCSLEFYRANDTSNCRKPPISRSLIQLKIISDLYYNPVQDGSGMDQWLDGGRENMEKACQILIMSAL